MSGASMPLWIQQPCGTFSKMVPKRWLKITTTSLKIGNRMEMWMMYEVCLSLFLSVDHLFLTLNELTTTWQTNYNAWIYRHCFRLKLWHCKDNGMNTIKWYQHKVTLIVRDYLYLLGWCLYQHQQFSFYLFNLCLLLYFMYLVFCFFFFQF